MIVNCLNFECIFGLVYLHWILKLYFIFPINWAYSSRAQGDRAPSYTCLLLLQLRGLEAGAGSPPHFSEPGAAWLRCPLSVTPGHLLPSVGQAIASPGNEILGSPCFWTPQSSTCYFLGNSWTQQVRWGDGDDPHHGHCTYSLTQVLCYIDWGWIEG